MRSRWRKVESCPFHREPATLSRQCACMRIDSFVRSALFSAVGLWLVAACLQHGRPRQTAAKPAFERPVPVFEGGSCAVLGERANGDRGSPPPRSSAAPDARWKPTGARNSLLTRPQGEIAPEDDYAAFHRSLAMRGSSSFGESVSPLGGLCQPSVGQCTDTESGSGRVCGSVAIAPRATGGRRWCSAVECRSSIPFPTQRSRFRRSPSASSVVVSSPGALSRERWVNSRRSICAGNLLVRGRGPKRTHGVRPASPGGTQLGSVRNGHRRGLARQATFAEPAAALDIDGVAVPPGDFRILGRLMRSHHAVDAAAGLPVHRPEVEQNEPAVGGQTATRTNAVRRSRIRVDCSAQSSDGRLSGRGRRMHPRAGQPIRIHSLVIFLLQNDQILAQAPVDELGSFPSRIFPPACTRWSRWARRVSQPSHRRSSRPG